MIINFLVNILTSLIKTIFGILPDLPATPTAITDGGQWIIDQIVGVISILTTILTPQLVAAVVIVLIAELTFQNIYHGVMFILRKIPVLNIK